MHTFGLVFYLYCVYFVNGLLLSIKPMLYFYTLISNVLNLPYIFFCAKTFNQQWSINRQNKTEDYVNSQSLMAVKWLARNSGSNYNFRLTSPFKLITWNKLSFSTCLQKPQRRNSKPYSSNVLWVDITKIRIYFFTKPLRKK